LLEARTPERKFHILEQALFAHVTRPLIQHPAVAFALKEFQLSSPYAGTIADVTERVGLSSRRFIQVFREEVGLTPKLFCRIKRFQEVLRRIGQGEQMDWADIALTCGYFDQAHCIHDFRAFSGITPGAYLAQRGAYQNHVALLD
jgi:AraC-like DNA-binding protein